MLILKKKNKDQQNLLQYLIGKHADIEAIDNGPKYFIKLIDYCSLFRLHYPNISKLHVKSYLLFFPESTKESKTILKKGESERMIFFTCFENDIKSLIHN